MTARREYPRCDRCRRRFGGQEAMRVAHTRNSDRCKTVRELRRNRLHRRADGVWVQSHPSKLRTPQQLRLAFRLGRPGTPVRLRLGISGGGSPETGAREPGTTTHGYPQAALPLPVGGEAA